MTTMTKNANAYPSDARQVIWATVLWLLLVVLVVMAIFGFAAWLATLSGNPPGSFDVGESSTAASMSLFSSIMAFFMSIMWMPAFLPLLLPVLFLGIALAMVLMPQTRKRMRPTATER